MAARGALVGRGDQHPEPLTEQGKRTIDTAVEDVECETEGGGRLRRGWRRRGDQFRRRACDLLPYGVFQGGSHLQAHAKSRD